MDKITIISGEAFVLWVDNVDTDQIVPGRFLSRKRSEGLGEILLCDLRKAAPGEVAPFPAEEIRARGTVTLISGANFGSGSSREFAVYALLDFGFRAIIAPSFGDIFYNNALRNGLLAVRLTETECLELDRAVSHRRDTLTVSLVDQTVSTGGGLTFNFEIDPLWRERLLEGIDEINLTQKYLDKIISFELRLPL